MGAPWREDEEQLLVRGRLIRPPHALNPSQKENCLAPRSIRRRQAWHAQGRHRLCPGVSLAIVLSDLPKPSGMGVPSLPPDT